MIQREKEVEVFDLGNLHLRLPFSEVLKLQENKTLSRGIRSVEHFYSKSSAGSN